MIMSASKLSAPLVGALLLVSIGLVPAASAAPLAGPAKIQTSQSDLIVEVGHRKHRRGHGWHGGHHGHGHGYKMAPRQIRHILHRRGYHRIKFLDRRGRVYVIHARGWRGRPMHLVVDARNARILRSRPLGRHYRLRYGW